MKKLCELSRYVKLHLLLCEKPIFFVCVRISKIVAELYLWWLKQYSSYHVLESIFGVRYQNIAHLLEMARIVIADKVYHTVAGFGPDHDIDIKTFDENYGTLVSKRLGAEYFNGKSCSWSFRWRLPKITVDGGYQRKIFGLSENYFSAKIVIFTISALAKICHV